MQRGQPAGLLLLQRAHPGTARREQTQRHLAQRSACSSGSPGSRDPPPLLRVQHFFPDPHSRQAPKASHNVGVVVLAMNRLTAHPAPGEGAARVCTAAPANVHGVTRRRVPMLAGWSGPLSVGPRVLSLVVVVGGLGQRQAAPPAGVEPQLHGWGKSLCPTGPVWHADTSQA